MSQPTANHWIHIGICPVCESGMCRVRKCSGHSEPHFFALCDECDSLWTQPTTATPERQYADCDSPICPVCSVDLYGPNCDWATIEDITDADWQSNLIVTSKHAPGT